MGWLIQLMFSHSCRSRIYTAEYRPIVGIEISSMVQLQFSSIPHEWRIVRIKLKTAPETLTLKTAPETLTSSSELNISFCHLDRRNEMSVL